MLRRDRAETIFKEIFDCERELIYWGEFLLTVPDFKSYREGKWSIIANFTKIYQFNKQVMA